MVMMRGRLESVDVLKPVEFTITAENTPVETVNVWPLAIAQAFALSLAPYSVASDELRKTFLTKAFSPLYAVFIAE